MLQKGVIRDKELDHNERQEWPPEENNLNLLFFFWFQQQNQEDLGLWEEKFGKYVDVKVNGKIETSVVLKQIFPKWLNISI